MNVDLSGRDPRRGFSVYDLWARDLERDAPGQGDPALRLQPALVRILERSNDTVVRIGRALETGEFRMDAWERERLELFLGDRGDEGAPSALFQFYWLDRDDSRIEKEYAGVFEIVQRGPTVRGTARRRKPDAPPKPERGAGEGPIVAVIDDGIGFLNRRFTRKGGAKTRFHAVWLQSRADIPNPPFGGYYTAAGQVLYRHEIDALLGRAEDDVYRTLNATVVPLGAHRSLEFGFTHGTHVADVAGGADPVGGDAILGCPLIGVQLPSEAVDNTAGWALEYWLLQGVRWILTEAERAFRRNPVIINVSFATFAGPKDGTKLIEAMIDFELRLWQARTGRCARAVYAFGNSHRDRQIARFTLGKQPQSVDLRVQPDNRAAAYVEIRPDDTADMGRLSVTLGLPGAPAVPIPPLAPNTGVVFVAGGGAVVAWFAHVGPGATAPGVVTGPYFLLAIAPTAGTGGAAPAGAWPIALSSRDGVKFAARIEVQRGDTPIGYPRNGRQCYLDHRDAYSWEAETQSYALPAPAGPITRRGTHSSYVTAPSPQLGPVVPLTVNAGAAMFDAGDAAGLHDPSPYTAEGAAYSVPGPHLSALADMGPGLRGIVASGTFTGSARTLDGTSVAAAQVTRAIATAFLAAGCRPMKTKADFPAWIDAIIASFGAAGDPAKSGRQGAGILTAPDGGRRRREPA